MGKVSAMEEIAPSFKIEADILEISIIKSEPMVPYRNQKQTCTECDKSMFKKHFKQHVKSVHTKIKDIFCEQCPSSFSSKQQLNQHLVRHGEEKQFECDVCDKMFKAKAALKVHSNIHTKEKLYFCDECGKTFGHLSYSIRHKKEQH